MLRNSYELFIDRAKNIKNHGIEQYIPKSSINDVQMAYFIAAIPEVIYKLHSSIYNEELIKCANDLVQQIESKKMISDTDFHKYSQLYSKWSHSNPIINLKHKFVEVTHFIKYYKYHLKNGTTNPNMIVNFESIIDKLIAIDEIYTIQLLIEHYKSFVAINDIKKSIWKIIENAMQHNQAGVMVILIEQMKNKIIPLLKNADDRRDIYYNIDIEYLIHDMDIDILKMCIAIVQYKLVKIYPSFAVKTDINIELFIQMFDLLFNNV